MGALYRVSVPLTGDMSPYQTLARGTPMESVEANALWHYNRAREHDGLSPLQRLPAGTRFAPATEAS